MSIWIHGHQHNEIISKIKTAESDSDWSNLKYWYAATMSHTPFNGCLHTDAYC
ncbi:MAG: hypothetical protein IPH11_16595 [Ignavibacteriales bacterium]|nr:hypothetical protein [Ignavibacteriales bacterium]